VFVLLALLLLVLQGILTPLLEPYPAPDLVLLAALLSLERLRLGRAVLLAYGLGMLQDLTGSGVLGFHALGLAGGVFCAGWVTTRGNGTWGARALALVAATLGKWLVLTLLLGYLGDLPPLPSILGEGGRELLATLAALSLLHPLLNVATRSRTRRYYL
jgi:rod shape-determining protein MreD